MTRLEKCELLKEKGYTYDKETGKIYGVYGKEMKRKCNDYIVIGCKNYFNGSLYAHHFAWYWVYGNVDFVELDHKDTDPSNNRISNLRISNRSQQNQNKKSKGYYFWYDRNKFVARIKINGKQIHLGCFNTEEDARNAYLEGKKKYHKS